MFDPLLKILENNLNRSNAEKVKISDDFESYANKDKRYLIKNWLYKSTDFRKWRITLLDGGDIIQVFNTVAYPSFNCELPLLGVDILWFGNSQKILAVLDYQPLIQNDEYLEQYCSKLIDIKTKYSEFDNTKMKNIYEADKYFSPYVIMCRGNKFNLERDLQNIFKLFVEQYFQLNELFYVNRFLDSNQIKIKQIEYDKYSAEKDPADKLFKQFFGEAWTEKFIKDFLFTLS